MSGRRDAQGVLYRPYIATTALFLLSAVAHAQPAGAGKAPPCIYKQHLLRTGAPHGDVLESCLADPEDGQKIRCYSTNLKTGRITPLANADVRKSPDPWFSPYKIDISDRGAEVCPPRGDCKTVTASADFDPRVGLSAAVDDNGQMVALSYLSDVPTVEVFDLDSGQRLSLLRGKAHRAPCITANFVGPSLLVHERDCDDDAIAASWLADPRTGAPIADTGGAKAFLASSFPARADAEVWAFASTNGSTVGFQDVSTGKVKKRLSLRGKPVIGILARSNAATLVVAYPSPRLGDLAVIDLATQKVHTFDNNCARNR